MLMNFILFLIQNDRFSLRLKGAKLTKIKTKIEMKVSMSQRKLKYFLI